MTRKRMTVLLFLILLVAVGVRADLPMLYSSLQKDLKEAQQYFNYMEKAYDSKEILAARKDLDMAAELAEKVEAEGEGLFRQSRIKLEEFWVNVSYSLPATTKMAYVSAEELGKKALARDISGYLSSIKELGFNGIIVETMTEDGYTLYPTRDQEQHRLLQGSDVLREVGNLAREYGLQLFLIMDVGFAAKGQLPLIASKYPDWVAVNEYGDIFDDYDKVYLNMSHPDVRRYYVARAQDLAGYNISALILRLDLPRRDMEINDYSYDVFSRNYFQENYSYDPLKVKDRLRVDWDEWRAEQINSLVGQISRAVTTNYPGVKVGAMVIVDDLYLDELKFEKLLDWKSWIERDYIDYFLPQINTAKEYDLMLRQMSAVRDTFLPYPVLTLGDDMTRIEFLQSINRLLLRGSLVFKDLDKLDQFSVDLLTKILTKKESTTLHEDPWRALMLNVAEIETQAPASWVADIRQLSEKLSKLVMAPTGSGYIEALAHVRDHIEYLKVKAITDSSAFGNRMDHELIVAKNLLELGASSRTAQGRKLY